MGLDYALVHAVYTIPPSVVLTLIYRPFFTPIDYYKIAFLVAIAVVSTIPWDSYLIRNRIWSYPPDAVLGPTLWSIPAEELFFFVIQTYAVSLLHLCLTKPLLLPVYLHHDQLDKRSPSLLVRYGTALVTVGQLLLGLGMYRAYMAWNAGGTGMYMGLIVVWAFPFLFLLWSLGGRYMLRLPKSATVYAIAIPTIYLWMVDTLALRRGTWVIETGTKLGYNLGVGLDIEEAVFFFLTDCLIVFGLNVFDYATTLLQTYPELAPGVKYVSPLRAVGLLLLPSSCYDHRRIQGLREANERLRKKSRSFYLASSTFVGGFRSDMIQLYSFCRAADDLVDGAQSRSEARAWVDAIKGYLDLAYESNIQAVDNYINNTFPAEVKLAFVNLQTDLLSRQPLQNLLRGFEMDLRFGSAKGPWPIKTQRDLLDYSYCVAGTVAELCMDLLFFHINDIASTVRVELKRTGADMGKALQMVNIARDIGTDAAMGRVYLPSDWLKQAGLQAEDVLREPNSPAVLTLRTKMLALAFEHYEKARTGIDKLPTSVRGPMRVVTESYMEIGRVLRDDRYQVKAGRATVPKGQRLLTAVRALYM